jgi:hypothetical protein
MGDCQFISGCTFFGEALEGMPQMIVEGYKKQYCNVANPRCARYVVATTCGKQHVPTDMCPHEETKAVKILRLQGHKDAAQVFA